MKSNLQRFLDAQASVYTHALSEIKNSHKYGHWMWFIFPQIQGLGFSDTSRYYAIKDLEEASEYLREPVLGKRLREICNALLEQPERNALRIFGSPDDMKLKSSMTLFSAADGTEEVFSQVLQKFFNGAKDEKTMSILRNQQEKH